MVTPRFADGKQAARYLTEGRVVAFPTGTAYGLAADALQGYALQRLRFLKQRPAEKSFTVFMRETLWDTYWALTEAEKRVLKQLHNKPLTLLVTPHAALAHLAQDGKIGLRVIDHPLMAKLSEAVEVPLTATSANIAGEAACFSPECIEGAFPRRSAPDNTTYNLSLAGILDAGTLPERAASTIARIEDNKVTIIRSGTISKEEIQKFL